MKPNTQIPVVVKSNNSYYPNEEMNKQMDARRKIEQLQEELELHAEIADYPDET